MHLRTGIEIHLAGNTRKAPEVLIFQVRTVAPTHHLHGDEVLAFLKILRDVKLGCHLGVLRAAHVLAINPDTKVTRGRTHVEIHVLTVPVCRQRERTAIRASVVIGLADKWRITVKRCAP